MKVKTDCWVIIERICSWRHKSREFSNQTETVSHFLVHPNQTEGATFDSQVV